MYIAFLFFFFFSSRRRHTRLQGDWSSDVCSSDLGQCQHGKTMLKISKPAILLVWRQIGRGEIDPGKIELFRSGARYGQVTKMHGIERSAKQSDSHVNMM